LILHFKRIIIPMLGGVWSSLLRRSGQVNLQTLVMSSHGKNVCSRCMASGRGRYIRGGSNKQDISEDTRELLKQARNPEEPSWKLGAGIQEPKVMDLSTEERKRAMQYLQPYIGRARSVDPGENDVIEYYPHAGEDLSSLPPPSPVLMVRRVRPLKGEPWFLKQYCQQIGLGEKKKRSKLAFLPNLPSVSLLLYKIKHLVEITPVTFPNGVPEDFDPVKDGAHLNSATGEFVVNPSFKVDTDEIAKRAQWMKLTDEQIKREAGRHWNNSWNSCLGNSNYYKDSRWLDNDMADNEAAKNAKKKY